MIRIFFLLMETREQRRAVITIVYIKKDNQTEKKLEYNRLIIRTVPKSALL